MAMSPASVHAKPPDGRVQQSRSHTLAVGPGLVLLATGLVEWWIAGPASAEAKQQNRFHFGNSLPFSAVSRTVASLIRSWYLLDYMYWSLPHGDMDGYFQALTQASVDEVPVADRAVNSSDGHPSVAVHAQVARALYKILSVDLRALELPSRRVDLPFNTENQGVASAR